MIAVTRRTFLVLALALFPALSGCAGRRRAPRPEQPKTYVAVTNNNFLDMTVYVIRNGGQRVRLGIASSNRTTRMEIPSYLIFGPTPISFLADPIGSDQRPFSQEIQVSPGDEVHLTIR
jgi:hypothetical protein